MKSLRLAFLALLLALPARAEVFNTARTLKQGAFSISGEFQRGLTDRSADLWSVGIGVGLVSRLDLGLRAGIDPDPASDRRYLGADLEFGLLQDTRDSVALSLVAGAHAWDKAHVYADATLLLSKLLFEHLEPYLALDADFGLTADTGRAARAVVGLDVPVVHHFELLVEAGLGLFHDTPHYASAGFNLYF